MTKDELKALHGLRVELECTRKRIKLLESAAEGQSSWLKELSGGTPEIHDKMAQLVAEAFEQRAKLLLKCIYYEKQLDRFDDAIRDLPPGQKLIMTYHYLEGYKWVKVSDKANYSLSHCLTLHKKAIQKIVVNNI